MENQEDPTVIPVIEEEIQAGVEQVKTGSVRVRKTVDHVRQIVETPVVRDAVEISRIPVNRVVESLPKMRREGDLLIVPVVEEEIVVQKRLILKEEIRIRQSRTRQRVSREVTVDREHATVERLDADGNVVASSGRARPRSLVR
jgi:uncharacterized protein (TIGR02271 family)